MITTRRLYSFSRLGISRSRASRLPGLLQLRLQPDSAAAGEFELPLPIRKARLLDPHDVLAGGQLGVQGRNRKFLTLARLAKK
jgi:hypothetical protein